MTAPEADGDVGAPSGGCAAPRRPRRARWGLWRGEAELKRIAVCAFVAVLPGLVSLASVAGAQGARGGESAQSASAQGVAGAAIPSIAALEGEWRRDEKVSEDPVQKTAGLWRNPARGSVALTGLAASLAERLGHLRLRVVDGQLRVRNARFETTALPADGTTLVDQHGNRHRVSIVPGALEIETARPGWLLIETFFRQAEQLHRVIEVQSETFPNLRFLTVYERYGDGPPAASSVEDGLSRFARPATIRILPPRRGQHEVLVGRIKVETLTLDRSIGIVDFLLDGRRVDRVRKLPFSTGIRLAEPPREQTLEVRAYSVRGAFMGGDRLVLNRIDPPFGIRIGAITQNEPEGDAVQVETRVAIPRAAVLERVNFYRNEELAASVTNLPRTGGSGGFRTVRGNLRTPDLSQNDYVRVTATLADGRELEDAQLIEGVTFKGEIDVQLIHLQVLVVDSGGAPVDGLSAADFRIVEEGERKAIEDVQQAGDVPLVLGMAIDSSASMRPIWNQLRSVVGSFLENSVVDRDRAFLVDFDESVRLLERPTGSMAALRGSMERLIPNGGTALNDGILLSLILFRAEPGRRALVVVTDGMDIDSRSEPGQAAAFAERVGIPLYLIDLGKDRIALPNGSNRGRDGGSAPLIRTARSADHVLRMTEQARQSGGRLFQIDPELPPEEFLGRVQRVFDQIREDLRRQQVLTYYTGRPVGAAIEPEVHVLREGLTVKSVLPLDRVDRADELDEMGEMDGADEMDGATPALPVTLPAAPAPTEYPSPETEPFPATTATTANVAGADVNAGNAPLSSPAGPGEGVNDDAAFVKVLGLPTRMATGAGTIVTVTVRNTGTTSWTPFGGYGLGSQSPEYNDTWGLRRAPLLGSVAPGETVSFDFPVTAPAAAGSYTFSWRMVRDPGGWFGSGTGDIAVSVEKP